jgi:uncharacterized protein YecE (DUF72 family)
MPGQLRIGISGWTYAPWRGVFYPEDLPQARELHFASRQLNSIEINGSFYSLQTPASYRKWYEETPDDFVFAVKGGRFITHMKRLRDVRVPLANFFASGVLELKEKLGPFLWQFPPNFKFDSARFEEFFKLLPRTTKQMARLASEHDARMKGKTSLKADADRPVRHAVEIRHESFRTTEFVELLRAHNVALVVADTAGKWPQIEDLTADFSYVRLHGDEELYVSGYTDAALDGWAERIRAWAKGAQPADARLVAARRKSKSRQARDVFVYFDNDVKVRSPMDAMNLARRLGLPAGKVDPSRVSGVRERARTSWPAVGRRKRAPAK